MFETVTSVIGIASIIGCILVIGWVIYEDR